MNVGELRNMLNSGPEKCDSYGIYVKSPFFDNSGIRKAMLPVRKEEVGVNPEFCEVIISVDFR